MNSEILSDLIITKVYSATTMYTEKNTKTKRNNRQNWAIVIKYEGETLYDTGRKIYISNVNNLVILPKGCSYEWCCKNSGHYSIIEFESALTCNDIFVFSVKKLLPVFTESFLKIRVLNLEF